MSSKITVLTKVPLFTLAHPSTNKLRLKDLFKNWSPENQQILNDAQNARDNVVELMKSNNPLDMRISAVDRYLPYALAIEREIANGVTINQSTKITWRQSPFVGAKYVERQFTGQYFSMEVLHMIWLKSVMMLNSAYLQYESNSLEQSVATLKEVAGIYHYLSSDKLRVGTQNAPHEFQSNIFNSLKSLCLGQVYSLIASKGERDGLPSLALAKLCYTISATFSSALDALGTISPPDAIHPQYINMLKGLKQFYYAASAIHYAYYQHGKDACGKAISLIRFAIDRLSSLLTLDRDNTRINEAASMLLNLIRPLDEQWGRDNFYVQNEYIPTKEEAELMITQSVTSMPNLPQPTPYNLPEPVGSCCSPPNVNDQDNGPNWNQNNNDFNGGAQYGQNNNNNNNWNGAQYGQNNNNNNNWNGAQYGQNNNNNNNNWNGAQYGQNNNNNNNWNGAQYGQNNNNNNWNGAQYGQNNNNNNWNDAQYGQNNNTNNNNNNGNTRTYTRNRF